MKIEQIYPLMTADQRQEVHKRIHYGYEWQSLMSDGSVELIWPNPLDQKISANDYVIYIDRKGDRVK